MWIRSKKISYTKIIDTILVLLSVASVLYVNNVCFIPSFDYGKVVRVIDGDTIVANLAFRGNATIIRLSNIDAYESYHNRHLIKQEQETGLNATDIIAKGKLATKIVKQLLLDKPILVILHDHRYGVYGRLIGDVYIELDNRWVNVNNYLVNHYPYLYLKEVR